MNTIYTLEIRSEAPAEEVRSALANFAAGYGISNTVNSEGKIILWSDHAWNCGTATPAVQVPAAATAPKAAKAPAKRINAANVGKVLHLAFHSPYTPTDDEHTLIKLEGAGDDARATFRGVVDGMEWEAYRFHGRWAYGSSANRLQVLEVK